MHPDELPAPKVQFLGLCIVDKRRGEVAEVPLFVGALEELAKVSFCFSVKYNQLKQMKKPKGKSKSKKPKQTIPKFNEVFCIINLIAPRVTLVAEEGSDEEEDEGEEHEHAQIEDITEPELLDEKDLKKLYDSILK